jgi:predicted nucleic acid-binding protein
VNGYLLDTNVPSELSRDRPEPRVVEWLKIQRVTKLFLSVVTIGEIRKIAATAIEHGLTVVSRNVKDFAGVGVDIFNPWEMQAEESEV